MKNISKITSKKGFTLIELLVVISIITILTALLTANFIGARQRARDGQRKSNLFQIQSALELYRSDQGLYPASLPACNEPLAINATYMSKVPCDPTSGQKYIYTPFDNGRTYNITACLENTADSEKDSQTDAVCTTTTGASYTLRNP